MVAYKGIIEPLFLSNEERRQWRLLLRQLLEMIWDNHTCLSDPKTLELPIEEKESILIRDLQPQV